MFLRFNRRLKDGKEHRYWNIVESKRCAGGKIVQRQVLYLGEINDSQREAWCRVIEAFFILVKAWFASVLMSDPNSAALYGQRSAFGQHPEAMGIIPLLRPGSAGLLDHLAPAHDLGLDEALQFVG